MGDKSKRSAWMKSGDEVAKKERGHAAFPVLSRIGEGSQ